MPCSSPSDFFICSFSSFNSLFILLFPFIYPIAISHGLLQLNGDGDTLLPLSLAEKKHKKTQPIILIDQPPSSSLSLFIFLSFFSSFNRSNSGQLAWTPNKQTKKWRPTLSAFPLTHQAKYKKEMCVDVQVKGFVMCLAVCESGRHWVVGLCLGCVCVACCQQGGWATGGAWSSKPFRRPSLLSFSLLTHQCSFSYCVFSFVHFISMEWCIGLNLSYPSIFFFFLPSIFRCFYTQQPFSVIF